mmetsp:Transcript_21879/g.57093  ORF Transcript_21879/g.57093 Transcript_21879/m.57093 type:complete len:241 (+) Transcript_21879:439-1161(+)
MAHSMVARPSPRSTMCRAQCQGPPPRGMTSFVTRRCGTKPPRSSSPSLQHTLPSQGSLRSSWSEQRSKRPRATSRTTSCLPSRLISYGSLRRVRLCRLRFRSRGHPWWMHRRWQQWIQYLQPHRPSPHKARCWHHRFNPALTRGCRHSRASSLLRSILLKSICWRGIRRRPTLKSPLSTSVMQYPYVYPAVSLLLYTHSRCRQCSRGRGYPLARKGGNRGCEGGRCPRGKGSSPIALFVI